MEFEALLFECARGLFGVSAKAVTEVLRAVALSPMPAAPGEVMGIINLRGRVVPVINTRKLLGLGEATVRHTDHFVVVDADQLTFALHVDRAIDLIRLTCQSKQADESGAAPGRLVQLVAQTDFGMVQVLDLATILPQQDKLALQSMLSASSAWELRR